MKISIALLAAVLVTIGGLVSVDHFWIKNISSDNSFSRSDIELHSYDLFDLGVVDANDDDFLDIYTVNHSAQQSLLQNSGRGTFRDIFESRRLDQSFGFPGLEDSQHSPPMKRPGLYIFRKDRWLNIHAQDTASTGVITGTLELGWPVTVQKSGERLEIREDKLPSGGTISHLTFELADGETIIMNGVEDIVEVPHKITISDSVSLNNIFVGLNMVNPQSHEFQMTWRDRHGMAWADFNGDLAIDVFIARGGIKGGISRFPGVVTDELFVNKGGLYRDQLGSTGITKKNCPSRQVAWVDFDADHDLDLYISCGRGSESLYPNQLYSQTENGRFQDLAEKHGLDFPFETRFAWFDSDNDNDMDLISVGNRELVHYVNQSGRFERRLLAAEVPRFENFTVSDYDNDGDLDFYAAHASTSSLFTNSEGKLVLSLPSTVGLPDKANSAAWVDYDNDGLVDLYTTPDGLFKQTDDHKFHKVNSLEHNASVSRIHYALATWFDADNDGARDLVVATLFKPNLVERTFSKVSRVAFNIGRHWSTGPKTRWSTGLFHNKAKNDNHWLQVKLVGTAKNRQAIGARVYVSTSSGTQLQQIGASEASHYSQGHYRLYFGLGGNKKVEQIRIIWPNGKIQRLAEIPADQLYLVEY